MNQFLFGPASTASASTSGAPSVRTWHGIAVCDGPEHASVPVTATRTVESIDAGLLPAGPHPAVVDETATEARQPGVNCAVTGVDPSTWRMVRLTLWSERAPDAAPGERFSVLHVSQPHRRDLPRAGS